MSGRNLYDWVTGKKCSNPRCNKTGLMRLEVEGKSYCDYSCYEDTRPTYSNGRDYMVDGDHR